MSNQELLLWPQGTSFWRSYAYYIVSAKTWILELILITCESNLFWNKKWVKRHHSGGERGPYHELIKING